MTNDERQPGHSTSVSDPSDRPAGEVVDHHHDAVRTDGTADSDERHPIELLADEFAARCRAGELPSIDEYEKRAPELRDQIRTLFPTIAMIERLTEREFAQRKQTRHSFSKLDSIGDFQIVREIGRGGMGVVYEAVQVSLGRRVALKVLGSGISNSPTQLQRFRREAESAARLHHTNIVPVYGIGDEEQVHFFAMQFIDGIALADAIEAVKHRSSITRLSRTKLSGLRSSTSETSQPSSNSSVVSDSSVDDPTVLMPSASTISSLGAGATSSVVTAESSVLKSSSVVPPEPFRTPGSSVGQEFDAAIDIPSMKTLTRAEAVNLCFGRFHDNSTVHYFQRIALIGMQVANALEYAHQHGVQHRDIKPSNLLLDRSGTVWITDFGLVKLDEHQDLTAAGEIVGTLRYMAPEQLDGRSDVRTDVYGLGLTLFELATLQPAFDGDQTATLAQRLRQLEIPRPRSVNHSIPRDLETIILKATARDSFARYPSAAALEEDLRRFVEDRPILARRSTYLERFWRWSRRNPALAAATASVLLLLGLVDVVATAGRFKVESALSEASQARERAESNLDIAVSAFDSILDNVRSRGLPQSLNLEHPDDDLVSVSPTNADIQLLNQLLEFYRQFAKANAESINLRSKTADAYRKAGSILIRLGRLSEAEIDFQTAINLHSLVVKTEPNNSDSIVKIASLYNDLGELLLRRGEFFDPFKMHLEARALLLEQPPAIAQSLPVRFELARATDLFASIDIRSGIDEGPDWRMHHRVLSSGRAPELFREKLGDRLWEARPLSFLNASNPSDGLAAALAEAGQMFRDLIHADQDNEEFRFRLAQCLRHQTIHAIGRGRLNEARQTYKESTQALHHLRSIAPENPKYLYELANVMELALRVDPTPESLDELNAAEIYAQQLVDRFPTETEYQLLLGSILSRRAESEAADGRMIGDAEISLKKSLEVLEPLARQFPEQGIIQLPLAKSYRQLGDLLRNEAAESPRRDELLENSEKILRMAIARFETYRDQAVHNSESQMRSPVNNFTLSGLYTSFGETLSSMNRMDDAERARAKAKEQNRPKSPAF